MENVGTFYDQLKYITANWYIIWPFGNLVAFWYIYTRFGKLHREKSGNPARHRERDVADYLWRQLSAVSLYVDFRSLSTARGDQGYKGPPKVSMYNVGTKQSCKPKKMSAENKLKQMYTKWKKQRAIIIFHPWPPGVNLTPRGELGTQG
jgi:hypothetical protein